MGAYARSVKGVGSLRSMWLGVRTEHRPTPKPAIPRDGFPESFETDRCVVGQVGFALGSQQHTIGFGILGGVSTI